MTTPLDNCISIMNRIDYIQNRQVRPRHCKCCEQDRLFNWIGEQKNKEGEYVFDLYNCPVCQNTIAINNKEK